MKKRILSICLMLVIFCSSVVMFSACSDPWKDYTEVSSRLELISAVQNEEVSKIKVVAGNYGSVSDYMNIVVTRPITIKGEGETKPVIYGSIVVMLDDAETDPVTIENLEISHSGEYVKVAGTSDVDFTKDGRRGVLVKNGGVVIKNNYIHLTDQNPATKLYAAPTGIQISVLSTNTVKNQLSYVVENNRIGKYAMSQTSASSEPVAVNCATMQNGDLNLTKAQVMDMFNNNTFDAGSECYIAMFDYNIVKYTAGAFSSEENAKTYMGDDYSYLADGLQVSEVDGAWIIVEQA